MQAMVARHRYQSADGVWAQNSTFRTTAHTRSLYPAEHAGRDAQSLQHCDQQQQQQQQGVRAV